MITIVIFNFIKFWTIEIYMANKEFEIIPGYRTEVVEEIRKMGIASLPDLRKRLGINSKATIRKAVARNPKGIVIQYVFDSPRGWTRGVHFNAIGVPPACQLCRGLICIENNLSLLSSKITPQPLVRGRSVMSFRMSSSA
jgi:hypothetical protein